MTSRILILVLTTCCLCSVLAQAQTNVPSSAAQATPSPRSSASTNRAFTFDEVESVRNRCIENRRVVCGKIVKILPGGFVVQSGYTNLMRQPLQNSWLIPGTVDAKLEPALVEKHEPESPCVGLVYLTDLPKSRGSKPKLYDYIVIEAFPAGEFPYTSVGTIQKTVRHFSATLSATVNYHLKHGTP